MSAQLPRPGQPFLYGGKAAVITEACFRKEWGGCTTVQLTLIVPEGINLEDLFAAPELKQQAEQASAGYRRIKL
jgi:hypothetical protein